MSGSATRPMQRIILPPEPSGPGAQPITVPVATPPPLTVSPTIAPVAPLANAHDWVEVTRVAAKARTAAPEDCEPRDRAFVIMVAGPAVGEMHRLGESATLGRSPEADIPLADEGISRFHAQIVRDGNRIVLRDLGSTNGTFCNGLRVTEHVLSDGDKIEIGANTVLKFTLPDALDERFQRQMYERALFDGLTRIYNRRYFLDRLAGECAFAVRQGAPLSLVLFDIDHFKAFNDRFGHAGGDQALMCVTRCVSEMVRREDVFARYGGEEFAIICRGNPIQGATVFADRIRARVASHSLELDGRPVGVTVSVGVASLLDLPTPEPSALIRTADEALYAAKRGGRNQVVAARPAGH